ncbi:MAG: alkaline phosphatase family protein [Gemmatimonadaceae bacterium]
MIPLPAVRRAARRAALAACAASLVTLGAARAGTRERPAEPVGAPAPTLVVMVTIDQFRADYLERFGPQLTGGLARLVSGGAYFRQAYHDHAITETAPGHATLLSGRFPRSTGIIANELGVDDPQSPLVGGAGVGASPRRFRGSGLADWLHDRDRRSRAVGISAKARSAILPLGRLRGEAYWYVGGSFVTSAYYADTLPDWVRRFNARDLPRRAAGTEWTLLLPPSSYPEPDSVPLEALGQDVVFPHRTPRDSTQAALYVTRTPRMDEILLALALEAVRARSLGAGPQTDLLAVSLTTTDPIGHLYGPDSREVHDQVLRLDRALGTFLDSLFRLRDPARVLVVLSSDHGVAPLPELSARRGVTPVPMRVEMSDVFYNARQKLRAAGGDPDAIDGFLGLVLMNRKVIEKVGLSPDSLRELVAHDARKTSGILRADRPRDLTRAAASDSVARRWTHQLPSDTGVELVLTLAPYNIWWSDNVASHQTPFGYDTHVPLIFYGPAFRAGRYDEFVRTVDLAPTLAAALGLKPSEKLDGVVLRHALR